MCCCCQLDDTRQLQTHQQNVHATQSELYEKTITDLRQDVDAAMTQLKESKEKVAEPSSLLLHLQKELLSVKVLTADFCLFVSSKKCAVIKAVFRGCCKRCNTPEIKYYNGNIQQIHRGHQHQSREWH